MINIRFKGLLGGPVVVGPAPYFVIQGRNLCAGPGGEVVATHEHFQWDVSGRAYSGWECTEPTSIHFENPDGSRSGTFGPFATVRFADGHCWADKHRLAQLHEDRELWAVKGQSREWRQFFLCPAE